MSVPAGLLISAPKGMVKHVGLSLGNGWVFHNNPEKGEHISSIADFAKGKHVSILGKLAASEFLRALERVRQIMASPKRYDALAYNCEHSLNRVLGRKVSSPQLQGWTAISLILGSLVLIASKK